MSTDTTPLFSSIALKGLTARNRLAVAPMTRVTATEDGRATDVMARYYERFSRGGFGMVFTEGTYPDQAFSQGYRFQPGMSDETQAVAWKPVVEAIRMHGAIAVLQMMHAGALSQGNRFRDHTTGPSAVQPKGQQLGFYYGKDLFALPREISEEEIADAIAGFGAAAERGVRTAGFDAVEIHGANGYLLDQFLTDYTNQRTDRWGGDIQSRVALILESVRTVREKVGASVPVGVRISQGKVNDYTHKWQGAEKDAEVVFGSLSDAGVDFIHVTEFEAWRPAFFDDGHPLIHLARKHAPKALIVANGNLHDPARAVAALDHGADIVSMGRGGLANPDLPRRFQAQLPLAEFDGEAILMPIANIKDHELAH